MCADEMRGSMVRRKRLRRCMQTVWRRPWVCSVRGSLDVRVCLLAALAIVYVYLCVCGRGARSYFTADHSPTIPISLFALPCFSAHSEQQ